jgi:hypothetical protein
MPISILMSIVDWQKSLSERSVEPLSTYTHQMIVERDGLGPAGTQSVVQYNKGSSLQVWHNVVEQSIELSANLLVLNSAAARHHFVRIVIHDSFSESSHFTLTAPMAPRSDEHPRPINILHLGTVSSLVVVYNHSRPSPRRAED